MVQATDFADWHNVSQLGRLDRPQIRCILGEGKVGSGAVVIREVFANTSSGRHRDYASP
jgi:hypothetical protein